MTVEHEKTRQVLSWFEEISKIPRCSKNEDAICRWMQGWADEHGFKYRTDRVNNLLIEVPAKGGMESAPIITLQGHMDMVCEKTKGSPHDFQKDPIRFVYEGDWLTADQTTLGADNGIAIALAFAIALDQEVAHPPLELLFTVDEETGLTGASSLEPGFLKGRILCNVDSEDEGVFTVGCAGGKDTHLRLPVAREATPATHEAVTLVVGGFKGGHSGVDIHEERGNAIQTLARILNELLKKGDVRIVSLTGGTAHNAIPRDAEAVISIPADLLDQARETVDELAGYVGSELARTDPKAQVTLETGAGAAGEVLTAEATRRAVDLLLAVPHGVAEMSKDMKGLVETSDNLATAGIEGDALVVLTSQRSSNMQRLQLITDRIEAVARLAGGEASSGEGYPSWQPNMDSPLLARCVSVYKELYGKDPVVEAIHAGLECGIIGAQYEGMDMISFGPTIQNPHSPDERLEISTVAKVWDFMVAFFKSYA